MGKIWMATIVLYFAIALVTFSIWIVMMICNPEKYRDGIISGSIIYKEYGGIKSCIKYWIAIVLCNSIAWPIIVSTTIRGLSQ